MGKGVGGLDLVNFLHNRCSENFVLPSQIAHDAPTVTYTYCNEIVL